MIKRFLVGTSAALMTCSFAAVAQTGTVTRTGAAAETRAATPSNTGDPLSKLKRSRPKPRGSSSLAVLRKRVDVDWDEIPFDEMLDWLREQGNINVIARWNALGVEAVDRESPITLGLRNETVATVLNEALDQLSETGAVKYRAVGGTIRISTEQDFNRKLYVRVYDATDLLMRMPNFQETAPQIDISGRSSAGAGGGGGGGGGGGRGGANQGSIFSNTQTQQQQEEEDDDELDDRLEELAKIIMETIAVESWIDSGGRGTIKWFNRSLIVSNTIEVHEQIAGPFSFD
ncbi:MAG: hypothetical protein ACE5E6_01640 [Phycisphaerae bacterium]